MRGYFGIGVEGISKPLNVATLLRTAHAFGASFAFTVAAAYPQLRAAKVDTSDAPGHVPFYSFPDVASMVLPTGCQLVGIEITEGAIELPSFHHPTQAAYVLGPERGALTPAMTARCNFLVHIPTRFSINLGLAGAIVMYDRMITMGRFAPRALSPGPPVEARPGHRFGEPRFRTMTCFRAAPPVVPERKR